MEVIQWLLAHNDYMGVIIGGIVLVVSSLFLPAKVRWYVLTAGFAIILFRVYQIATNKKRLAEADAKLKQLQDNYDGLHEDLNKNREALAKLNTELDKVREERAALAAEVNQLAQTGGALDAQRDALNERLDTIVRKNNKLIEEIEARESAVSVFDEAERSFSDTQKAYQH